MNSSIKLSQLYEIINGGGYSKQDLLFVKEYLSKENGRQLDFLLKEGKTKYKNKVVKSVAKLPIKNQVITVFNQPMFACEFALAYAKIFKEYRIAVIDIDRFNPTLDIYLNSNYRIKSVYSHLNIERSTGLNLLIDALHKNKLNKQYVDHLSIKIDGLKNLHYFSGSYLIEDYEYFKLDDLKRLFLYLKDHYDIIVLNTNHFIYDAFTCYALMNSDINLLPVKGCLPEVKEKVRYMNFLYEKQNISPQKNYYILFDHHQKHIKKPLFEELVGGYFLGTILFSLERNQATIQCYRPTKHMSKSLLKQYEQIIENLSMKVRCFSEFNQKPSHAIE